MSVAVEKLKHANVAIFGDATYIDTVGNDGLASSEFLNIKAGIESLDHTVSTFSGITATDFTAALAGQDVLVLPELELAPLALDPNAAEVVSDFVGDGGTLIVGGTEGSADENLINAVFQTALVAGSDPSASLSRTGNVAGTTFAGGLDSLQDNSGVWATLRDSLPENALSLYKAGAFSGVSIIPYGQGQIILLSWDWFNAKPDFQQDGGWLKILKSAISETDGKILGTNSDEVFDTDSGPKGEAFASGFDDSVFAKGGDDTVFGAGGNDVVKGGGGDDVLYGEDGDDRLYGENGKDRFWDDSDARYWGGDGKDGFGLFNAHATIRIQDFDKGEDRIVLDGAPFGLLAGDLDKDLFHKGDAATTADQRIIYDKGTGFLWFDPDGTGSNAAYHIATLKGHPSLSHNEIEVVQFG